MTYREPDLTGISERVEKVEKRLDEQEDALRTWRGGDVVFKERWKARVEAIRATFGPTFVAALACGALYGIVGGAHGCAQEDNVLRESAGSRCEDVCNAIGMSGSAIEVWNGAAAGDPLMDCYCGFETRRVTIHHDGTVSGIDVATGVSFGPTEDP